MGMRQSSARVNKMVADMDVRLSLNTLLAIALSLLAFLLAFSEYALVCLFGYEHMHSAFYFGSGTTPVGAVGGELGFPLPLNDGPLPLPSLTGSWGLSTPLPEVHTFTTFTGVLEIWRSR